jgi:hypothetical protein
METYEWEREIFIDLEKVDLDEFNHVLSKYGVEIEYRLPGITFIYDEKNLGIEFVPQNISFYTKPWRKLVLNVTESFGCLEFYTDGTVIENWKPLEEYTEEEIEEQRKKLEELKAAGELRKNYNIDKAINEWVKRRHELVEKTIRNDANVPTLILPILE